MFATLNPKLKQVFCAMARRVNPPKLGPKPEDLDWGLSKEAGGAREEVQMAFVAKVLGYASINCTEVFPEMATANIRLARAVARVEFIWYLYWASQNRRCPRAQATIVVLFLDNFWVLKPPKTKKGGYPRMMEKHGLFRVLPNPTVN